jgi:hypothetical protein
LCSVETSRSRGRSETTDTITATGSSVGFVGFEAVSTEAAAAAGPILSLYRNSASPAASDTLGQIEFNGKDSGGNKTRYAYIASFLVDPTNGSEDANIFLSAVVAGVETVVLTSTGAQIQIPGSLAVTGGAGGQNGGAGGSGGAGSATHISGSAAPPELQVPSSVAAVADRLRSVELAEVARSPPPPARRPKPILALVAVAPALLTVAVVALAHHAGKKARTQNAAASRLPSSSSIVAPAGDFSIAITQACLEPASLIRRFALLVANCAGLATATGVADDATARFFAGFDIEILRSVGGHRAATTEAPRRPNGAGGGQSFGGEA